MPFINRTDAHAVQTEKGYLRKDGPITKELVNAHLHGEVTLGAYQIDLNNKVIWTCFDFDGKDLEKEKKKAVKLHKFLVKKGFNPLLEFSGKKGYHVWLFVEAIDAASARHFCHDICKEAEVKAHEIFPKQDEVTKENPYGNLVKLPLGKHMVSGKQSELFHPETHEPLSKDEAIKLLINLKKDELPIYKIKKIVVEKEVGTSPDAIKVTEPCTSLKTIMAEGVGEGERNQSQFIITLFYKKNGLSQSAILEILKDFNLRCEPPDDLEDIKNAMKRTLVGFKAGKYDIGCKGKSDGALILQKYCPGEAHCDWLSETLPDVDDIPTANGHHEEEFKNIFPDNHFISKYIKFSKKLTDAYPEYHLSNALAALSIVANRKVVIPLTPTKRYTNLWILNIGHSTISRKSTSVEILDTILELAELSFKKLPDNYSPEALIDSLADNPKAVFLKDEMGGFLKELRRSYKSGLEETLCRMYDCPEKYIRQLRKETIEIKQGYLSIIGATTPVSISEGGEESYLDSGFFPRFLFLFPERQKKRMKVKELNEEIGKTQVELSQWLDELYKSLRGVQSLEITPSKEAIDYFNDWQEDFEEYIQKHNNPWRISAFYGRAAESALKISALIEIGYYDIISKISKISNISKISKVSKQSRGDKLITNSTNSTNFTISKQSMMLAIYYVQNLFIPHSIKLATFVEKYKNVDTLQKVFDVVVRNEKITHSDLLRFSNMKAKDFGEIVDTLVASKRLKVIEEETKTKPKVMYVALDPDIEVSPPKIEMPVLFDVEVPSTNKVKPKDNKERLTWLIRQIKARENAYNGEPVYLSSLADECQIQNISLQELEDDLQRLMNGGIIYEPLHERYKIVQ
jgi:hypothetical protein